VHAIREQVSSALDLIIHLDRLAGGARKIIQIVEITGMEGETICLHDLFRFVQKGVDVNGDAYGDFEVCGVRPHVLNKLKAYGIEMTPDMFQGRTLPKPKPEAEKTEAAAIDEAEVKSRKGFWR